MIGTIGKTLRDTCTSLAPNDKLDAAARRGATLSKDEQKELMIRKRRCVSAAIALADGVLEGEDQALINPVREWCKQPSEEGARKIHEHMLIEGLIEMHQTHARPGHRGNKPKKAAYYACKAAMAEHASEAASYTFEVASALVSNMETTAIPPLESGSTHSHVVGMIATAGK